MTTDHQTKPIASTRWRLDPAASTAQFSVHTVAGRPSRLQNCVVLYIACTGSPAAPSRISSVLGRFSTLNASAGAA